MAQDAFYNLLQHLFYVAVHFIGYSFVLFCDPTMLSEVCAGYVLKTTPHQRKHVYWLVVTAFTFDISYFVMPSH